MIHRAGFEISPTDVEEVIMRHPEVEDAAAFPIPHPILEEDVGVAIVRRSGSSLNVGDIIQLAKEHLSYDKVPSHVVFVENLPRGSEGTVDEGRLAEQLGVSWDALVATPSEARTTIGSCANVLTALWRSVFGPDGLNSDEDFFSQGGNSLQAMHILTFIKERLGVELSLEEFFDHPSLYALAQLVIARLCAQESCRERV